ncbi:ankyrin repeat-containing domain protein, partial [Ochromonadaceae sp. CCMP2298]
TQNNETPLHWCARLNSLKTARALLSHGAHVDAADNACSTPLHYAALAGALEIVPLLLE